MKKLNKNQSGFGAVEILLILILIGILGAVGWFVYDRSQNSKATPTTSANKTTVSKTTVAKTDAYSDWTAYTNKKGKFSLKYPKAWVTASSPEFCTETLLLLGGNADSVGKCASEGFGQMFFDAETGNVVSDLEMKKADYSNLVEEKVTIDGLTGKKQTGTFSGSDETGMGPAKGDKMILYMVYDDKNNTTYRAGYNFSSSYPDVLSDFNTVVTKTLTFTN